MSSNMIKCVSILVVSITALFMNSCASAPSSPERISGFAMESVEKRAPFDMECNEVSTQLLGDVTYPKQGMSEMNIGVIGCGKKASYLTICTQNGIGGFQWDCTPHLNSLKE
ncbi:MAG: hypothetical protein LBH25_15090 [Fibromonadaceae bacterium]|nr:hypothetical protein [Fibromonadaceae bacterium]